MSEHLLAKKGQANPAAVHHGGESRFQARRVVVLPSLFLKTDTRARGLSSPTSPPRPAARMDGRPAKRRKKFTFRIEPDRHARFCRHADALGISRQELLTRALDTYLSHADDTAPRAAIEQPMLPLASWTAPHAHDRASDVR